MTREEKIDYIVDKLIELGFVIVVSDEPSQTPSSEDDD